MNGAESLVATLLDGGVEVCFTNPGTSEMHIVEAIDRSAKMRSVLALFEGVATGAADGYARMAGKPACTLLHLGPGLANGLANLHNASRARTPVINVIGQHATRHLQFDTPLKADIEGLAKPYSDWVRTSGNSGEIGKDAADAIVAARTPPGQVATLIVPADFAWGDGGKASSPPPQLPYPREVTSRKIDEAAGLLRSGLPTCLLLTGDALHGLGLSTAGRIAAATGAKLLAPYPFARMERGVDAPPVERVPYIFEQAVELLKQFRQMILVGATPPRSYFAHPTMDSVPSPAECEIYSLAVPGEDYLGALEALANVLNAPLAKPRARKHANSRPLAPSGPITIPGLSSTIGAVLPENTIVVDESMTSGRGLMEATVGVGPHDWLGNTGGSIGIAMPLAVGAAVACPERRVLCLSADGSGMYTLQALWTMAREGLSVTTVIYANRTYGVLKREFLSLGLEQPGKRSLDIFEIGRPDLDWVSLAKGMGVPGRRLNSLEEFARELRNGFVSEGPSLIQVDL
jgi:acetolactate synthase I/II/III large subunit